MGEWRLRAVFLVTWIKSPWAQALPEAVSPEMEPASANHSMSLTAKPPGVPSYHITKPKHRLASHPSPGSSDCARSSLLPTSQAFSQKRHLQALWSGLLPYQGDYPYLVTILFYPQVLLWDERCSLKNSHVEVLTPRTSGHDLI